MSLLARLRAEAERRGLLAAGGPSDLPLARVRERGTEGVRVALDAARAFELVRDMPYGRASSREPETTVAEWRGTCSGKHYLLRALLDELGHETVLIACTHEFTAENSPWLPPHLLAMVEDRPAPDVHNFLRVASDPAAGDGGWMTVDATYPLAARALGLPVNDRWVAGRDMRVACDPIEVFHVPDDADPQRFKDELIAREAGEEADRRGRFIEALSEWLASITEAGPTGGRTGRG